MVAALERQAFFNAARIAPFGGSLSQGQTSGLGSLLDACPPDLDTDALAYCLATAFLETGRTMLPIKEHGGDAYFARMYDISGARPKVARTLGNLTPGDGIKFCGRGYVQLTGRANYRRATGELRNHGYLDHSLDLTVTPDMAMTPDIAAAIMFLGMQEGWFTGRKLAHYFTPTACDPLGARAIVNGTDRAADVAGFYRSFHSALTISHHRPGGVSAAVPTPPVTVKPAAKPSLFQRLAALFRKA